MNRHPIPDGYHSITPYLKLSNGERLAEFLKSAFGGIEKGRLTRQDGTLLHAEILVGDSVVMVHEAPSHGEPRPSTLYHYVGDVDSTYRKAIEAGGLSITVPTDMYYGDRVACVRDVYRVTLIRRMPRSKAAGKPAAKRTSRTGKRRRT